MIGVGLSRWTLAYFAVALAFFVVAQTLMVLGFGFPGFALQAPETLVLVHLVAVGWLTLLICGALFQFVPVLVGAPLRQAWVPLPALGLLTTGLLLLVSGFLQLGGYVIWSMPMLAIGALLLLGGFCLVALSVLATFLQTMPPALPARYVILALLALSGTVGLGVVFAFGLSGLDEEGLFAPFIGAAVPMHAALGIGGWLTLTAIGVTHRLLPMFMLAPDKPSLPGKIGWWAALVAILAILAAVVFAGVYPDLIALALLLALGAGLVLLVFYGLDIRRYYRLRRRKILETNSRMAALALFCLFVAAVMLAISLGMGARSASIAASVYLAVFGWLSGLGLSQAYKIVPFMTWLECYGPVMGRMPTPRVQDLVIEKQALPWFLLYFAGVGAGTVSLLAGTPLMVRLCAALVLTGSLGIIHQIYRARLLKDVPETLHPAAIKPPRLFVSTLPAT